MWQQTIKPFVFSYWQTLFHLYRGRAALSMRLDLPLKDATKNAWSAVSWTVICALVSIAFAKVPFFLNTVSFLGAWKLVVLPLALILALFFIYGFFIFGY